MGCASKISSTVRDGRDDCLGFSKTWVPILASPLGAVDSSGGVVYLTYAPVVAPVLLSLSSDYGSSPFLSPFLLWR